MKSFLIALSIAGSLVVAGAVGYHLGSMNQKQTTTSEEVITGMNVTVITKDYRRDCIQYQWNLDEERNSMLEPSSDLVWEYAYPESSY